VIFVTVGHQMPFDRLVRAVDEWAGRSRRNDVFAQIGNGSYHPANFDFIAHLDPAEYSKKMSEAGSIIAHAGTGTIIAALELNKPLLVMPRLSTLGETRNDHQIPTTRYFAQRGSVLAAMDEDELIEKIDELEWFRPRSVITNQASPELINRIRNFALGESF
jgi:UDP-N-acetylglucosamine transferase subunit ALG13